MNTKPSPTTPDHPTNQSATHPATTPTDPAGATPTSPRASRSQGWPMLLLAGGFEIGYALSVGGSHAFTVWQWSITAAVFFLLTLWALSLALRTIDVGLGYAVWAGTGAAGTALLGPVFFPESLTLPKALWLTVIITGVVTLKLADRPKVSP
ncbi:DMT family transporter [Kribbella solani]|uniref:Quaternary ammonium compound-resistance protein SugE n=1 Tax=Kribbella solani TaxID=236067 RepID=A0A841DPN8_9ACTN|nr:multidrug efflux SMR transporter [Kribbella solani]MBB5978650.1 quaternary ammonium compound-resistance protein SugE [Kribbella solani]